MLNSSSSSARAVGHWRGAIGALGQQAVVAVPSKFALDSSARLGARVNTQRRGLSPGSAGALGQQEGFRSAHVLRRSLELVEVNRSVNSMRVAPLLLQPHAGRGVGLSSTHPVRLAQRPASVAVGGLGQQGRRRRLVWPTSARSTPAMPPNKSFNRTANGMAPWPRGAVVHHAPRGRGATPSSAG
jgi:hypothetical protein